MRAYYLDRAVDSAGRSRRPEDLAGAARRSAAPAAAATAAARTDRARPQGGEAYVLAASPSPSSVLLVGWLAITAPLSKSLQPIAPPQLTLLAADGTPIARRGAIVDAPVKVSEAARPRGRAVHRDRGPAVLQPLGRRPARRRARRWRNLSTGRRPQGGSTITQQLAKFTFLTPERTLTRKAREALIALLARGVAEQGRDPRALSVERLFRRQRLRPARRLAALLLPQAREPELRAGGDARRAAPGALAARADQQPRAGARRMRLVLRAMVDVGYLTSAEAAALPTPRVDVAARDDLPDRHLFRRLGAARGARLTGDGLCEPDGRTTLDSRLQAPRAARSRAPALGGAQVALVAMRPDGRGRGDDRRHATTRPRPFNRATPGAAPAGLDLQAVRLSRRARAGLRARRPDRGHADRRSAAGRRSNYGGAIRRR